MAMGPNADIEALDFGPPEELKLAEALVLSATLGAVAAARLASRLFSGPGLRGAPELRQQLQRIVKNSKDIGNRFKTLGAATIEMYLSAPISTRPFLTLSILKAAKRSGESNSVDAWLARAFCFLTSSPRAFSFFQVVFLQLRMSHVRRPSRLRQVIS